MKHPAAPQFVEHSAPTAHPRDIFARFFAASVGATDIAIAKAAAAPATRNFAVNFVIANRSSLIQVARRDLDRMLLIPYL
jgi:hypothetical protein